MSDSSTLSFRLKDDIIDRLDDAATQADTSRSELAREALLSGLEDMANGDGTYNVPDHLGHDAEVRRMIARNKKTRRQGKFRSEFSKQLKTSFSNNEHPREFRDSVQGYIEESETMGEIPAEVAADLDADVETYREWVDHMLEYYSAAWQSQSFDADPINDPLGNHEGIENAKDWVDRAENIANAERQNVTGDSISAKDRQREMAQYALEDGVVPDQIEKRAEQSDDPAEVVSDAAQNLYESNRALTDQSDDDNPELDR